MMYKLANKCKTKSMKNHDVLMSESGCGGGGGHHS